MNEGDKVNEDIIKKFKQHCTNVWRLTPKTANDYVYRIRDYNYNDITIDNFNSWLSILNDRKNSNQTINTAVSAFKAFCRFLRVAEHIDIPYEILDFKQLRVPKRETIVLFENDVNNMLKHTKDKTMFALLTCYSESGCRFSELIDITYEEYLRAKELKEYTLIGKFDNERTIAFTQKMIDAIEEYLPKREKILSRNNANNHLLFVSKNGYRMSLSNINGAFKNIASRCNLNKSDKMSSHKIRHFFITNRNYKGDNIVDIADYVGHKNISTTNRYLHSDKRLLSQLKQA